MSEDVSSDLIKKTQKSLGKYVKKPPLTEKLLRKPPFRFLHDIIITIVSETNYLKGLFTEDELNSDKVKEKEAKVAFLNKLIEAVKNTTKIDLPVRSSKIIAGLEPAKTNSLLQAIAIALDSNVDSSSYVNKIKSDNGTTEKKVRKIPTKEEKTKSRQKITKEEAIIKTPKAKNTGDETPKAKTSKATLDSSRNRDTKTRKVKDDSKKLLDKKQVSARKETVVISKENKTSPKTNDIDSSRNVDVNDRIQDTNKTEAEDTITDASAMENISGNVIDPSNSRKEPDESLPEQNVIIEDQVDANQGEKLDSLNKNQAEISMSTNEEYTRSSVVRPKSARPKSGEKRILSAARQEVVPINNNADPRIISATQQNKPTNRPKSSLRPPSVRPSSARPGAPRLRPDSALPIKEPVTMGNINVIVENVDAADDEETVVIETVGEAPDEKLGPLEVSAENKGQLVEQILEQIAEEGDGKRKTEIDWETEAFHSTDGTHKDVSNLRGLIQKLTKTANPLGKLINYLHEDIDAMHNELQIWSNTKRQLSEEIIKQKKISIEANKPLTAHLDQLQKEINKQQQEITMTHSNILRNDMRIKELLSK
ncbi:unnamed protein product [Phaedon cochleariae]|uniref:TRAF3-interacting protein 1 n=1 Tax=Phaedon cochleariae TaxID=80249 RepID=A0A9P0DK45_PHACE|nr:unnamed protein product [Phaedon cochleariae]